MTEDLHWWKEYHHEDYQKVDMRLDIARNVMLHGRADSAARMLKLSCINSVMSIQSDVTRHEKAFALYSAGDLSVEKAAEQTVYGYQKADWLHHSLATFDFDECVRLVREEGIAPALEFIVENFKGLSYRKGAFALAMCGIYELMCLDSNTEKYLERETELTIPHRDDMRRASFSARDYLEICECVNRRTLSDMRPFTCQWAMYDYERGEHARHMIYFTEVFPHLSD